MRLFLKKYGLGPRTVKTGIAVFVCLCIGYLVQKDFPVYACITAIIMMQDTPEKSIYLGKARLIGTGIGGVMGTLFLWIGSFFSYTILHIIIITISVIVGLTVCYIIKQKEACSICAVVIVVIIIGHTKNDMYLYAAIRIIETALGVIIAVLINRYIWPNLKEKEDINNE